MASIWLQPDTLCVIKCRGKERVSMKVGKYTAEDYQKGREQGLFETFAHPTYIHNEHT